MAAIALSTNPASGQGERLSTKARMLVNLLEERKLISAEGKPTTKVQSAIKNTHTAQDIGLIPVPRGIATKGRHDRTISPLPIIPAPIEILQATKLLRGKSGCGGPS